MPSRVMLLEEKAWKRCLKCGTRMFTTSSIRMCSTCHRQNDRVLDRLVRIACPPYVLERVICN